MIMLHLVFANIQEMSRFTTVLYQQLHGGEC